MIRPKNDTENLLLSITKNCKTLIEQLHTKPQQTLEFKMIKPRETFPFHPPVEVNEDWMIGLTDLQVYNSTFNITEENIQFKPNNFLDSKLGAVSYEKVRDDIEKELDILDITDTD